MEHLDPLIRMLDPEEQNLFAANLEKASRGSKEGRLFDLLTDGVERTPDEIMKKLYTKEDYATMDIPNAYHSLRKRLLKRIFNFLIRHVSEKDPTDHSQIPGTINVCRICMHRDTVGLAKHFIRKAEKSALQYRQYDMLDLLYNFMIENSAALGMSLKDVIGRSIDNARKIDINRKLNYAVALIRENLESARNTGKTLSPDAINDLVLRELKLDESHANIPTFQFRILDIYRFSMISNKEYYDLEAYVQKHYDSLRTAKAFTRADREIEQAFLFFLAHAQYRNRKFTSAKTTLQAAENLLSDALFRGSAYYLKMISLKGAIFANSGYNHLAIPLMEKHMDQIRKLNDSSEQLNMLLNCCVYQFNASNFKSASALMRETDHFLKKSKKNMGKEWIFKKRLIHLIIRIEMESLDEAIKLLKGIRDDYKDFFKHPVYERAGIFLNLVEEYLMDPMKVTEPEFFDKVKSSGLAWPGHKEDIQAITFFCWLLSKMMKRPYYVVLMERMSEGVAPEELTLPVDFEERYGALPKVPYPKKELE